MNRCICGNKNKKPYKRDSTVSVSNEGILKKKDIKLVSCNGCGIIRQTGTAIKTQKQYNKYYEGYPPTKKIYTKKTYKHDRRVAGIRCESYKIPTAKTEGIEILDVGSGSGAFVDECRSRGLKSFGCELGKYHYEEDGSYIYRKGLLDIHFPTDHFDIVTCHDVVEHVLDPVKFIKEMFRITKQNGRCIIDFPNFFNEKGNHHWKDSEHVWFFTEGQLANLLKNIGFIVDSIKNPLKTRSVFYATRPTQKRVKILVPPGMGDSYWSIVKMQSFLKSEGIDMPDICIAAGKDKKYNGHVRAVPFLQMFPFVNAAGGHIAMKQMENGKKIWNEAYSERGRTVFRDIYDHDYMLSYNGHIRWGVQLEDVDPQYECDWHPPMFVSLDQENFKNNCIKQYGKYFCIYLPLYGHYVKWLEEFSLDNLIKAINKISKENDAIPVLVGAQWDAEDKKLSAAKGKIKKLVDLTGKTDMQQLFGCLRGSELVFGFPSGLTIMSAAIRCKTLMVWNDFYEIGVHGNKFYRYVCPPDTWNKNYFAMNTATMTVNNVAKAANDIISDRKPTLFWPERGNGKIIYGQRKNQVKRKYEAEPITILCIHKTGDGFNLQYVEKLKRGIERNTTVPYKFVCLTDKNIPLGICESIILKDNLIKGSMVEMFRSGLVTSKHIIYFSLDTIITGNIDRLLIQRDDFIALKPWHLQNKLLGLFAPGMMLWKNGGTYSFIYDQFKKEESGNEIEYITNSVRSINNAIPYFQDSHNGIYSYKRHCRSGLPKDARVICFLNRPKPHDIEASWLEEHWI